MNQIEALTLIAAQSVGIWLGMAVRGEYTVYDRESDQTIPRRVWDRLLDRGDVEIKEGWGVNDKYLMVTEQGRARIGEDSTP